MTARVSYILEWDELKLLPRLGWELVWDDRGSTMCITLSTLLFFFVSSLGTTWAKMRCVCRRLNFSKYWLTNFVWYPFSMYAVYSEVAADRKSLSWVYAMLYRCSWLMMTPSLHCVASLDCGCGNRLSFRPFFMSAKHLS